jgi:predicted O-methyltransferase YrrM
MDPVSQGQPVASLAETADPSVFNEIVRRCHGMLPPAVYKKIYEFGRSGGLIVEVGTALGAGTAALALGLRDSGKPGRVVTFDPMTGGPLRQVSDATARAQLVRSNLEHFGIADLVDVVTDTLGAGFDAIGASDSISVFMIDADGRIDRDLLVAAPRLRAGTKLIIDDIGDELRLTDRIGSKLKVDQKMRLAFLLLERFKRAGLISEGRLIKETYFGEVLRSNPEIPLEQVLEAYRELVFGYTNWRYSERARRSVLKLMERWAPGILQRARVLYRNAHTKA